MQPEVMWTLEKAREDYLSRNPKKLEKKTCKDCIFSNVDWEGDVHCGVRERYVIFPKIMVSRCKYFNSKYPYKKYRK